MSDEASRGVAPPKFPQHSPLHAALRERVDEYFRTSGRRSDGGSQLVVKTLVIFAWLLVSYGVLVFWAPTWWAAALLAVALSLAVAGVGFNVQHDGGHDAYAAGRWGNRLAACALDLVGGSSYVWRYKHVMLHHQFPNVQGVDDDIDAGPLLRLSPGQARRPYHRFQHWYTVLLFGFLPPKWTFVDDFRCVLRGRVGPQSVPRPRGSELALLIAGKVVFVGWVFVLPLAVGHSLANVLAMYAVCAIVTGACLSIIFQLAHCVEGAAHPAPDDVDRLDRPWAELQLATTVDFAPRNRLLSWYVGGLNFQVEHHLFPRVSHVHYAALAPIVRRTCAEHGAPYLVHDSFFSAVAAHVRHLRSMGRR